MLINGTLVSFAPATWLASVRPDGSAATVLTGIPVASNVAPADLIVGRRVLIWPGETGEPGDFLLVAVAGPQVGSSPLPSHEGNVLARAGNATIFSNTSAEQTLFSYTVPAGLLRTDRALRFTCLWNYLNNTGANRTFTLRVKLGATTLYADATVAIATSATIRPVFLDIVLGNADATNDQALGGRIDIANVAATTSGLGDLATASTPRLFGGSAAEDSTADLVFAVTLQASNASNSHTATRRLATLELL